MKSNMPYRGTAAATLWTAIIPVKDSRAAKSRLGLAPPVRRELALAMAMDTIEATIGCAHIASVLLLTPEPEIAALGRSLGAGAIADHGSGDLNGELEWADRMAGQASNRVVIVADMPGLDPSDLALVLQGAPRRGFVADRSGTGTVLLCAREGFALGPAFGPNSARLHAQSGASQLQSAPSLVDVDTLDDLQALGRTGARTRRLLARI